MIDLSTSYLGLNLRYTAGRLGISAVARSGWSPPAGGCGRFRRRALLSL